jgi:hypothetical protein
VHKARHIRLAEGDDARTVRLLSSLPAGFEPSDDSRRRTVTLTRTGTFTDPRYGEFEITRNMLLSMVRNFQQNVVGTDIFIDVAHQPADGAAAKVVALAVDGNRLRAEVEFTDFGIDAIRKRGFRYLSAEYHEDWCDNEAKKRHGCTLLGAGLTNRPVIKRLDPIQLSESDATHPVLMHPELARQLSEEAQAAMNARQKALYDRLIALGMAESVAKNLAEAYGTASKALGEDDDAGHKALSDQFYATAQSIKTAGGNVQLSISAPGGLTAEDVTRMLSEDRTKAAEAARKLSETRDANVKTFNDAIAAAKGLSDATKKLLSEGASVVTEALTQDQVKALAAQQIALGDKLEASKQLSALGFAQPGGTVRITSDERNGILKLSDDIRVKMRDTTAAMNGQLRLSEDKDLHPFAKKVLAQFDAEHAMQLHAEIKCLAGETTISDTSLPASFQREVIREALSDMNILYLVSANVDATAGSTHQIPYSYRDVSASVSDGRVYEGQGIPSVGMVQAIANAYIEPLKLAIDVSLEVENFSRNNGRINYDAYAESVGVAARYAREIATRKITNELQRSLDCYGAVAVSAESYSAQANGAKSLFKTTNFPIVRPYQARDLAGTAIGSVENGITVLLNNAAVTEYDGTGTQSAGNYFQIVSYNLGTWRIVNQLGVAQTPTHSSGSTTIAYTRVTNVALFDTDLGSLNLAQKMTLALQKFGERKARLSQDRYVEPNFALTAVTLHDMLSNAENFEQNRSRVDMTLLQQGDIGVIKGLGTWKTNAPGTDMGEDRVVISERGLLRYTIQHPFSLGAPFEKVNSSGQPIGKRGAYGAEFSSMHVPTALRGHGTSLIMYSATARTAI